MNCSTCGSILIPAGSALWCPKCSPKPMTTLTPSAEQRARDLLEPFASTYHKRLAELTDIITERDELKKEVVACLENEPSAVRVCEGGSLENLAASLAVTMAKVRDERDSFREKAEVLDWLEKQDMSIEIHIHQDCALKVELNIIGEDGCTENSYDAVTLLSAINQVKKGQQ